MTQGPESEKTTIMLGLLSAVERDSELTQRSLSSELGIALGLANAYLKRCVNKGLIKVRQTPLNRYAYYLTPRGFAEKSRLTADFLTISFNFFRSARNQCSDVLAQCSARGWRRIALAGVSDLSEIATLCAADSEAVILGIIDPSFSGATHAGLAVVAAPHALGQVDAIMITDFRSAQSTFDRLTECFPPERVVAPPMLKVSTRRPTLLE